MASLATVRSEEVATVGIEDHCTDWHGLQTLSRGPRFRPLSIELQAVLLYPYRTGLAVLVSIVCQSSTAFSVCYFPLQLSLPGRLSDPGTFLPVPLGYTKDTVMRDMAHNS